MLDLDMENASNKLCNHSYARISTCVIHFSKNWRCDQDYENVKGFLLGELGELY